MRCDRCLEQSHPENIWGGGHFAEGASFEVPQTIRHFSTPYTDHCVERVGALKDRSRVSNMVLGQRACCAQCVASFVEEFAQLPGENLSLNSLGVLGVPIAAAR